MLCISQKNKDEVTVATQCNSDKSAVVGKDTSVCNDKTNTVWYIIERCCKQENLKFFICSKLLCWQGTKIKQHGIGSSAHYLNSIEGIKRVVGSQRAIKACY